MPRRVSLPGADELFRTTGGMSLTPAPRSPESGQPRETREGREARESREGQPADAAGEHGAAQAEPTAPAQRQPGGQPAAQHNGVPAPAGEAAARRKPRGGGRSRPTGRERHEEKITVYVSAEELIDLEHARLVLRGEHGLAVDRGRIVREAVAVVLADLEQRGEASILVRRLRGR
ncbi:hypothetical protein ACEZCY_03705 [Streptacidiphilus sp. N1-12]|uniref:Cobyrinic acid a,c-diamide synthase n=2 Tax=Streptacidiphilus alkalitolerans TaxID=3342712 RepID=A0ABV6W994_9ACTN